MDHPSGFRPISDRWGFEGGCLKQVLYFNADDPKPPKASRLAASN